jgi:hypothetical protein
LYRATYFCYTYKTVNVGSLKQFLLRTKEQEADKAELSYSRQILHSSPGHYTHECGTCEHTFPVGYGLGSSDFDKIFENYFASCCFGMAKDI